MRPQPDRLLDWCRSSAFQRAMVSGRLTKHEFVQRWWGSPYPTSTSVDNSPYLATVQRARDRSSNGRRRLGTRSAGTVMPVGIAVLSGGVAGAFVRLLLHGAVGGRGSSTQRWLVEILVAFVLGMGVAVSILLFVDAREWATGCLVSGLTTYAAASATLAYRRGAGAVDNPRASAFVHFAWTYLAMIGGFVVALIVSRFFPWT